MSKFRIRRGLHISLVLFEKCEALATRLQKAHRRQLAAAIKLYGMSVAGAYGSAIRRKIHKVYQQAERLRQKHELHLPKKPRQMKVPTRLDDHTETKQHLSFQTSVRVEYFKVIDRMQTTLKSRFDQKQLQTAAADEDSVSQRSQTEAVMHLGRITRLLEGVFPNHLHGKTYM